MRVEFLEEAPLTVGFRYWKDRRGNLGAVQFEKLANLCCKCGRLTYLTSQCSRDTFEKVTLRNDMKSYTYGLWLRVEKKMLVPLFYQRWSRTSEQRIERETSLISLINFQWLHKIDSFSR